MNIKKSVAAALAGSVCVIAISAPAIAQARAFQIPAGSMKGALDEFRRQSGIQVIYRVDQVSSARSAGVSGEMTAREALGELLSGSGLEGVWDPSGAVAIKWTGPVKPQSKKISDKVPPRLMLTSEQEPGAQGGAPVPNENEIIVTATKKSNGETVQDVPLSITAFGQQQLEKGFINNIEQLTYSVPNVQFSTSGTYPTVANFSIRGLGTNNTLATAEPSVGVFVDGMYLGTTIGVVTDNFDLEGIEILRGPQGVLFGRNVTGGAVLIRTTTPSDKFVVNARLSVESGLNRIASAVVSGPIVEDKLAAKVAGYYQKDSGYFDNIFTGTDFGKNETYILRSAIAFTPSIGKFVLKGEHGKVDGTGLASQNFATQIPYKNTNVEQNYEGFIKTKWNQLILQSDIPVGIGDGTITSIIGYRNLKVESAVDADGTPQNFLNAYIREKQHQFSAETRYFGSFGNLDITTGLYYFYQYVRENNGSETATRSAGGGRQRQNSYGVFAALDWNASDALTLSAGLRYTYETKAAAVAPARPEGVVCAFNAPPCDYSVFGRRSWNRFIPKAGVKWEFDPSFQVYGQYAHGIRSGNFNIRASNQIAFGPTDPEKLYSFELGAKKSFGAGQYLNISLFRSIIHDLQRDIRLTDPTLGVISLIANAGDAKIQGVEIEGKLRIHDGISVDGFLGYIDGKYTSVRYDLNGDLIVDQNDKALKLPKLAPWSYGAGVTLTQNFNGYTATGRVDFRHRSRSYHSDNNLAQFRPHDELSSSLSLETPDKRWVFSIYGRNLLNKVSYSSIILLPTAFGGVGANAASPNKARVLGGEIRFSY